MTSSLRAAFAGGAGAALAGLISCSAHSEPLPPAVFATYLTSCARQYPVILQAPVSRQIAHAMAESGLQTTAIHDNTTGKAYTPAAPAEAAALARQLLAAGHRIDGGVMQVTDRNWPTYGLTVETVFDPHANICAGARILGIDFVTARKAACLYNTGRAECSNGYPEMVQRAEARLMQSPAPAVVVDPPQSPERKPEVFDVLHGTFVQTGGAAGPVNLLDHRRIRHEADVHYEQGKNS